MNEKYSDLTGVILLFIFLGIAGFFYLTAPTESSKKYDKLLAEAGCDANGSVGVETKSSDCISLNDTADKAIRLHIKYNEDEKKTNDLSRSELKQRLDLNDEGSELLFLWMYRNNYIFCMPTLPSGADCEWGPKAIDRYDVGPGDKQ